MKKIITGIIALCITNIGSLSANVITVSNNTVNAGQYTSLQAATNAAKAGDTVYVIGSPNNYGTDTIKTPKLTIIGAGYNVTGTENNYNTTVNYIYLRGAVYGTTIQGIYISNNIQQVVTAVSIDSVDIERCYVPGTLFICGHDWTIRNNNIDNLNIGNNANILIQNNFLEDVGNTNQATVTVDHNDFVTYSGNVTSYTGASTNALFQNNVFYYCNPENTTSCTFKNNFTVSGTVYNLNTYAGNTGNNNVYTTTPGWTDGGIPASTVSQNAVWNYIWTFTVASHAHDSATDGTDIGITGGVYSMPNLGGLPRIPEMVYLSISGVAPQSGNLNVNFKAQGKMAHGVAAAEYFFDNDPGRGNGTPITIPTNPDSIVVNQVVPISPLTGYHVIGVRVKDSTGHWSLYRAAEFYVQPIVTAKTAPIIAAEYFYDNDPGQGKGTAISFTKNTSINITQSLPIGSLTAGYHNIFVRVEDSTGVWSLYAGRNFYVSAIPLVQKSAPIIAAEYFYDNDPGQGNGTAIASFTKNAAVNITQSLPIGSLTPGYHNVFVRVEDSTGVWSLYSGRNFYVSPTALVQKSTPIMAAEYFYDTDPGQGKGTAISVTKADSVNITQSMPIGSLTAGFHNVFVRVKDSTGVWSLYAGRNFYVSPTTLVQKIAPIVAAEYFFDADPGQGKGTAITGITAADTISMLQNLNASALAIGPHNAFIRVEDSTGHWSIYQGAAFKVEICSDKVTATATKDSCYGSNDGTATALASGGNKPYTYAWNTTPVQTTTTATSLTAGIYTVTVTDSIGCPATATVVVGQPTQIKIKTTVNPTTCGLNNGSISASATGGTGSTYTYSWNTVPVQTSSSISNLSAGIYTVTVFDQNMCSNTATVNVVATSSPTIAVTSVTPSKCGEHIGSASVSVTGGTLPYWYSWNNGDTLSTADSLHSGNYIITVTDKNGCSIFTSIAITNSDGPVIKANGVSEVKCYGQSNGSINISVTGGTAPLTYAWSNGATTSAINNLSQGPYYVTVTDATGCSGVQTFKITQPTAPVSLVVSTTNSDCSTPDGTASVVASGGTSPYTYNWSGGITTTTATGLGAGAYEITVVDSNGCIDSTQAAVSSKNGPVVTIDSTTASTCASGGKGSGTVVITVTGGTGSDSYLWSDISASTTKNLSGVPSGVYNVIVTDQVGCVGTAAAKVGEVAPPALSICMVTVDPKTNHNYVIWDKSTAKSIASYNVYKETTVPGLFNKIGSVPVKNGGTYIDSLSNPDVQSWRYEISQVDSCGFESALSKPHKTMHLTINQGTNNYFNLIWDNYQGLPFNYYIVYRDSVPGVAGDSIGFVTNNGTYTFSNHVWTLNHSWYYHMGISNPGGCTPSIESINYNASKSNTGNYTVSGLPTLGGDLNSLIVYPNPTNGVVNFSLNLVNAQSITMRVYNALGQLMSTTNYGKVSGHFSKEIDLSGLSKGIYILQVSGNNDGNTYKKIVLQ